MSDTAFDLSPIERVLDRWWGIAVIRANPLSDAEREQVAEFAATHHLRHRPDRRPGRPGVGHGAAQ